MLGIRTYRCDCTMVLLLNKLYLFEGSSGVSRRGNRGSGPPSFLIQFPQDLSENVIEFFEKVHFHAFARVQRVWSKNFLGLPPDPPIIEIKDMYFWYEVRLRKFQAISI